ncbi:multidrug effflux MFS transporter [Dialister sp.]|uniref:multidrug effflux MFS transporter n=1 Tax=Dialister sp. TaxID=1955814 RepID=UPI003F0677B8
MKLSEISLFIFLGLMTAIAPLSTDMYLPALPKLAEVFGISPSLAQLTLTMTMAGMALGQLIGGPLSDRFGRKVPVLVGMTFFTLSSYGASTAETPSVLLLYRFMQGFFGSFGLVIARAIARDLKTGAELLTLYSALIMINGLAPVLAPVAGGQILRWTDWRGVFYVLTAIGLILALNCIPYKETLAKEHRLPHLSDAFCSYPHLFHDSYFMGHCLLEGFLFISFFGYLAGSSFLFQHIYGLSAQIYSLILGMVGVGLLLTGLLPAALAKKVLDDAMLRHSIILSFIGSLFLLAGLYFLWPLPVLIPILIITIIPLSITETVSMSMALSRQGKNAGAASALLGFFSVAPGSLTMPLTGIAGEDTALPLGLLMAAGYALCLLSYWKWVHGK